MKASEFYEMCREPVVCDECGKKFYDKETPDKTAPTRMKKKRLVSRYKQLAGHILRSNDHLNKKWAKEFFLKADVGTGPFGDFRSSWGR
jgi:hypothetical protein